ncbi:MAG: hypothetical protein ACFB9N_14415 [Geitlerinemataceae cyanobacterium]
MIPFFKLDRQVASNQPSDLHLSLTASRDWITKRLFICVAAFFCGHFLEAILGSDKRISRLLQFRFWTGMNEEMNIPTLFSVGLLLTASLLLGAIAYLAKRNDRKRFRNWRRLCVLFAIFALDELLSFHEGFSKVLTPILEENALDFGFLYHSWVLVGAAFAGVIFLVFIRFVLGLPTFFRNAFILSGLVFVSGSIGMEMINGAWLAMAERGFVYDVLTGIEEALEMSGVVIFIYALMTYLQTQLYQVTVTLQD